MSLEQLENTLLNLPHEERRRFARWFYEHVDDIVGSQDGEIHPEVQAEIMRRRAVADAHPEQLESWEGTTERVRSRLHELRHQETENR